MRQIRRPFGLRQCKCHTAVDSRYGFRSSGVHLPGDSAPRRTPGIRLRHAYRCLLRCNHELGGTPQRLAHRPRMDRFHAGCGCGVRLRPTGPVGRGRRYRHHASRLSSVRRPDKSQRPAGSGKPAHSRKGMLPDRLRRPRPQTGRGHGTALLQSTQPHRPRIHCGGAARRSCAE